MVPAHQRFHPDQRARVDFDLGLVVEEDFVFFDRAAQEGFQPQTLDPSPVIDGA
jgi:hypothetical protein